VYYQHGIDGWLRKGRAFGVLEPYDGKLSCPVLREGWGGNAPVLPGCRSHTIGFVTKNNVSPRRDVVHFNTCVMYDRESFLAGDCVVEKSFLLCQHAVFRYWYPTKACGCGVSTTVWSPSNNVPMSLGTESELRRNLSAGSLIRHRTRVRRYGQQK
jgi:hypothetical protein